MYWLVAWVALQSVTNIFEYSYIQIFLIRIFIRVFIRIIFWIRIYSYIRLCQLFGDKYIRIFVHVKILIRIYSDICLDQFSGHKQIQKMFLLIFSAYRYFLDINDQKCYLDCKSSELVPVLSRVWRIYSNIQIFLIQIFIRIIVRIKILIQIYSDIRSYQKCSYEYIRIFVHFKIHTNVTLCFIDQWWKNHAEQFPLLAGLVRVVFGVPVASSKSERVFSVCWLFRYISML